MTSSAANLYALLIGVTAYHPEGGVIPLRGCANDVVEMERLLVEGFGAPGSNIITLTDEQATHAAIVGAIQRHLIARADEWLNSAVRERAEARPIFLFYFSGHGSQTRDLTGQEPDGMDETIVPYDSRTQGVYDIRDWELGQMVEALSAAADNIVVILDCCHSGSGTRAGDDATSSVRGCPADLRPQPSYRPPAGAQRGVSGAGWELGAKHVLIAGCRDRELANELSVQDGDQSIWRGALTYFLQQEVQKMNPDAPLTYREVMERVRSQVTQRFSAQTPQCEGDMDREFLGGLRPSRDRFFTIVEERAGLHWLDAGIAHGVRAGAILAAFPWETRTLARAGNPLARLEVVEERAARSGCRPITAATDSLLLARAVMERAGVGDLQRTVRLAIDDAVVRDALVERLAPLSADARVDVSPYVRVVDAPADFTVALTSGRLEILDRRGAPLAVSRAASDLDAIAHDLAHMARYHNALELTNDAPASALAGLVTLSLQRLILDPTLPGPSSTAIPAQPGGEVVVETGERIVLEIRNRTRKPLYVGVFNFAADFAVVKIFPRGAGAHEALPAGRALWLGRSARKSEQLEAYLPHGVSEARDLYKVIASTEDVNFDLLEQEPLGAPFPAPKPALGPAGQAPSALDRLLALTTGFGLSKEGDLPPAADGWTTAEAAARTVANRAEVTQAIVGGGVTHAANFPISFAAPPDFDGQVRVLTQSQAQRSAAGDVTDLQPPPGLAPFPELFQPLGIGPLHSMTPHGALIELEMDEHARQRVTPASPLTLHLDWALPAHTAGLMAFAYDGSVFFPVGRATGSARTIPVEWLPPPDPESATPERSTRSLAGAIKLYLYRVVGASQPQPGLHAVRFLSAAMALSTPLIEGEEARSAPGGQLRYRPPNPAAFGAGQRVAVVAPGFGAESSALAAWVAGVLPQRNVHYDHVLAFDDETPGDDVMESGRRLLDGLRRMGLDRLPGLRLDIFAHGMGALIARCLVELLGGDRFIDRCFLLGMPNQGTPLADSLLWTPWLVSLLVNQSHATPPWMVAWWSLGKLGASTQGPKDLRPTSALLMRLSRVRRRLRTRYYVLAGDHSGLHAQDALWQRLAQKMAKAGDPVLDPLFESFFRGRNDLVVPLESMVMLGGGRSRGNMTETVVLPCNHFTYLDDASAQAQLCAWIEQR